MGTPQMIHPLVAQIPEADNGFALYSSEAHSPGYQMRLDWVREEFGGNWKLVSPWWNGQGRLALPSPVQVF